MALTKGPAHLIHGSLLAPPKETNGDRDPVEVRMVRDAQGYTYHERRPHLVEAKAGETLTVSRNLAVLWAASGQCVLFSVKETAAEPAPVVQPEPAAEPKALEIEPPKPTKGKRRRRRK